MKLDDFLLWRCPPTPHSRGAPILLAKNIGKKAMSKMLAK